MKAYSLDLRQRVFEDCDSGMETRQVAVKYRVSDSWIRRLKQRRRDTGETTARSSRNRRTAKWLAHAERIKELIAQKPDATLAEPAAELNHAGWGQTLSRALRALPTGSCCAQCRRESAPECISRPPQSAFAPSASAAHTSDERHRS